MTQMSQPRSRPQSAGKLWRRRGEEFRGGVPSAPWRKSRGHHALTAHRAPPRGCAPRWPLRRGARGQPHLACPLGALGPPRVGARPRLNRWASASRIARRGAAASAARNAGQARVARGPQAWPVPRGGAARRGRGLPARGIELGLHPTHEARAIPSDVPRGVPLGAHTLTPCRRSCSAWRCWCSVYVAGEVRRSRKTTSPSALA